MKRFYSKRQRLILSMVYGRVCKKCKSKVNDDFHVDHIKPFCLGGKTTLENGQILCPKCNLKKGGKIE